jgi:subtilisin family serine protease
MRLRERAAAALGLALLAATTALPSAARDGASGTTQVRIVAPAAGTAAGSDPLSVHVEYANGDPRVGVHALALLQGARVLVKQPLHPARSTGAATLSLDPGGLPEGRHELRARAYEGKSRLAPYGESAPLELVVDRTPPTLALGSPPSGSTVTEPELTISGSASDSLSGLAGVTCAGVTASLSGDGFSCAVVLDAGANTVVVAARDRAGNLTTASLSVTFSPGGLTALPGAPGTPALDAIADVTTAAALVPASEVSGSTVRTQLELVWARDATVGDVNALLTSLRGRIVSQREGVLISVVRIPDPGSLEALETLLGSLEGSPALRRASLVLMAETAELPAMIDATGADVETVRHHLAVRGHAAWNARAALATATTPTFVIGDEFGDGPPGELFGLGVRPADYSDGLLGIGHGYHVLGIAAAAFDPVAGAPFFPDAVTGAFPGPLDVRAVDMLLGLGSATVQDRLLEEVEAAAGNVVVNTSLQAGCETPADAAAQCTDSAAAARAAAWIERVRGSDPAYDLEGEFLHLTAAGNQAPGVPPIEAAFGGWDAASGALLQIYDGPPSALVEIPKLTNTLVVENFAYRPDQPYAPACRSDSSESGGTIAAVGEDVRSFSSTSTTSVYSGTSMATPGVAGTAAFVWALRPALTPQQLVALLRRTGTAAGSACGEAPPVLDAYAAVLAADEGDPARPARSAILDVAAGPGTAGRDGNFDEDDVARHLDALSAGPTLDYGRHDLNGDGETGGDGTGRVDLDADGVYDTASLVVEGVAVALDETRLTDEDVLCFFGYSSLYTGDGPLRDGLLAEECLAVTLDALLPSVLQPEVEQPLVVVATRGRHPLAGVELELDPTGGAVGSFAGTTGADGTFSTTARLFAGRPSLSITIRASSPTGMALAETTATATAAPTAEVTFHGGRGTAAGRAFFSNLQPSLDFSFSRFFDSSGVSEHRFIEAVEGPRRGSSEASYTAGGSTTGVSVTATGRVEGTAPNAGDPLSAGGSASPTVEASFEITGGSVTYSLSGSVRAGSPGIEGGNFNVSQVRLTGPGGTILAFSQARFPDVPAPLSVSGTLGPGVYSLLAFVNTSCFARGSSGLPSCASTGSASISVAFG